jgi:hypothetical protein
MISAVEPVFELPGGVVLDDRVLRTAELSPFSGREEDWLAAHPNAPAAVAVTSLLGSCIVRVDDVPGSRDLAKRMLVGDRDFLMLQLRRLTLGERIQAVVECAACRSKVDVDFDAADVPVERRPHLGSYDVEVGGEETRRSIRFRLPTGADQEQVLELEIEDAASALMQRCILDDSGRVPDAQERSAIERAMENAAPEINLELDLECPECGSRFLVPFDTTAFFLSEMHVSATQLLREVHTIAFHYHWSEEEILRLKRPRRRAYLGVLSDALRSD